MGELIELADDFIRQVERVFQSEGRLTTAIAGYHPRKAQQDLANAIAVCISAGGQLAAEAGTGTGKTYAYLVPALLSGKKAVISTATKTLQDQLFEKDLPQLIKALGLSIKAVNLKGRANYICLYRTHLYAKEGHFDSKQQVHDIQFIAENLSRLQDGLRTELPEISDDALVWPFATSTADNCLGQQCPHVEECHLIKARRKALEADVVVINHHLFFADSQLKREGFAELLPGASIMVFDEAHQLHDIATQFNGQRLGSRQIEDLIRDIQKEWPADAEALDKLSQLSVVIRSTLTELVSQAGAPDNRHEWQQVWRNQIFQTNWVVLFEQLKALADEIQNQLNEDKSGLKRCEDRLQVMLSFIEALNNNQNAMIVWVETYKRSLIIHMTPQSVAEQFSLQVSAKDTSYIFTSATLTMADSFEYFVKPLGLNQAKTAIYPSPFDYAKQALLYLPRRLPDVKDQHYLEVLLEQVIPIIESCGGRTFFLFTSHKSLKWVADRLKKKLQYPLLVQGEESKTILLSRFRALGNAVLLGTATFWEGVDVKGEALSCVIIDKLPFSSPADPVTKGRMAYIRSQGLSPFDTYSLPQAVIALKQGVGRLIRDATDAGVFVIGDPRLIGREYGRQIFASLPPVKKTRCLMQTLLFIENMRSIDEMAST